MIARADQLPPPAPVCPEMVTPDVTIGPVQPLAVSIRAAAAMVGVSERTLAQVIADGELSTARIGARRVVPIDELRRWLAEVTATR